MLQTWSDGPAKSAIVDFVASTDDTVPAQERVAVFDNDGTLWCEKPAYIQLDFLVRRLADQARSDPQLANRQPYRAAASGDLDWFGDAVTKHYLGDDSQLKTLGGGILGAFAGLTVEEHADQVRAFFASAEHPSLRRPYTACRYAPMIELLRYLEDNAFTTFIASGGGRDFIRPVADELYGIPPERVIGSSVGLDYSNGDLRTTNRPEFLDDGPVKPVRIWGRTGRRPVFAAGNSDGDIEMLEFTRGLRMLVLHDDPDREFEYTKGAEKALEQAERDGWTVVSIKHDWTTVFGD